MEKKREKDNRHTIKSSSDQNSCIQVALLFISWHWTKIALAKVRQNYHVPLTLSLTFTISMQCAFAFACWNLWKTLTNWKINIEFKRTRLKSFEMEWSKGKCPKTTKI